MARKLLNNPLVVAGLVFAAIVITFWNVVSPLVRSFAPATITEFLDGGAPAEEQESRPLPRVIDYGRAGWIGSPARDPFQIPLETAALPRVEGLEKELAPAAPSPAPARERFRLVAVVVERGMKYATINKTHVAEGDSIEGYRVVGIKPDSVQLSGPLGKETLNFEKQQAPAADDAASGEVSE